MVRRIPQELRRRCIPIGIGTALLVSALIGLEGDIDVVAGGWSWQSVAAPATEGVVCVCAAVVLVDVLRGRRRGPLARELARSAYGASILQAPVLVGLALLLQDSALSSLGRLAVVAPLGIALSFAAAALLRRVPGPDRIL